MPKTAPAPSTHSARQQGGRSGRARPDFKAINKATNEALRSISIEEIVSHFGLENQGRGGTLGGHPATKYRLINGEHLNISPVGGVFATLNGKTIDPLDGKRGGGGAISLTIALMFLEGNGSSDPTTAYKMAADKLKAEFRPQMLDADYKPGPYVPRVIPPREAPKSAPAVKLPPVYDEYRDIATKYLVDTRKLPSRLVKHLIDSNIVYPSKHFNLAAGKEVPSLIFPCVDVKQGFSTSYEHKELPRDPKRKTQGYTHGKKTDAVMMLGNISDKTKRLVMTEAPIDGMSKWVIERPTKGDTCIVATIGVRLVESLFEKAKEHDIEIEFAFDCDNKGAEYTRKGIALCKKMDIRHSVAIPQQSEALVRIPLDAEGKGAKRLAELAAFTAKQCLPSKFTPHTPGAPYYVAKVGNNMAMWELYQSWKDDDDLALKDPHLTKEEREAFKDKPKFQVEVTRNKDWNDLLVKGAPATLDWPAPHPTTPVPAPAVNKPASPEV